MELKTLKDFEQVGELIGDIGMIDEDFSDVIGRLHDTDLWYIITFNHYTDEIAGMTSVDD